MGSDVYFADMRATPRENLLNKVQRLLDKAGLPDKIKPRDLVAIKLHFGEKGNTSYIRPPFFREIVERVKGLGGRPFLTDANTLYAGTRSNSISHLITAIENGFSYSVVGAPLIIADGLRGGSYREVSIQAPILQSAFVAADIVDADALIGVAHFKGHDLSGFGGALKNIGMGCAARKGKLIQHSTLAPKVKAKKCKGCGDCTRYCPAGAISILKGKAAIKSSKCIGCGECITVCPEKAVAIQWNEPSDVFQKKMVEYALGALKGKEGKVLFLNFLTQISPACDCYGHCDAPIVRDIGILASTDPVAIDQASVDLVNRESPLAGSCLGGSCETDNLKALYPHIDWSIQLQHGERLGMGSREYRLIPLAAERK
jgi:uncharacterized Fe-S center protein